MLHVPKQTPPRQVFAIRYMVFSRRSLSHPRANFGRGVMTATSLFSAFHITNIATLFLSFTPAMNTWVGEYHANFNRVLLSATWVFGYLAAVVQLLFTIMLLRWSAILILIRLLSKCGLTLICTPLVEDRVVSILAGRMKRRCSLRSVDGILQSRLSVLGYYHVMPCSFC